MRVAVAGGTGTVGRLVVAALRARGHDAVVLSRSGGTDLLEGAGLTGALQGCEAVVDVAGPTTLSARRSATHFGRATANLLRAGRDAGVGHHVALSIVGAAAVDAGYYAGHAVQERLLADHDGGWSLLRSTQFHELVAQTVERGRVGPLVLVPRMLSQPVAAAEVAAELADLATGPPAGVAPALAGPLHEDLPTMVADLLHHTRAPGRVVALQLPGRFGSALARGDLLPPEGTRRGRQTFEEWLREGPAAPTGPTIRP